MKTIRFKNGDKVEVVQDIANILAERIEHGCEKFQIFRSTTNPADAAIIINVEEIVAIY